MLLGMRDLLMRVLMVGLGGAFGALARYGISIWLNDRDLIPWGTLAVNLMGCFLLALFLTIVLSGFSVGSFFVLAVSTGFVGSFTTFSAISVESILLMQSFIHLALLYLLLTFTFGYICTWAGCALGNLVLGTGWGERWCGKVFAGGKGND